MKQDFTEQQRVKIAFALEILDEHFDEIIIIAASENKTYTTMLKFGEAEEIVQHGVGKLGGLVMKVLPNAIYNMCPYNKKRTHIIFSGIVKFLNDISGKLQDFHVITEEIKKDCN